VADGHPQRSHDGHEGATVLGDLAGQLAQRRARGSVGMGSGRPANQLEPARGTAQVVVEVDAKERELPVATSVFTVTLISLAPRGVEA
jgi:hypothetical protein